MRRLVFVLLLALVFTICWEGMVGFVGFGTLSRAVGLGAAALGVVTVIATGQARRLNAVHYLMGLFVAWAFASLIWSANREVTNMRVMTYFQLAGMAWLIWEFAATPARQALLMHAYVLGGCVGLATQWISIAHAGTTSRITAARFHGGGLDANFFALAILISIALAAFNASNKQGKSRLLRLLYWCYCPMAAFGVLMTGSRMGFVVLLFALVLIVLSHLRIRPLSAVLFIALGAALAVKAPDWMPATTFERLAGTGEEFRSGTWSYRRNIWSAALEIFPRHPIIGTGSGSFSTVIGDELVQHVNPEAVAHNTYLNILVELGIIGLCLFSAMLVPMIFYALRMPRREQLLWMVILATWCVAAFTVNRSLDKTLWFTLGLLTSQYAVLRQRGRLAHARKMIPLGRPRASLGYLVKGKTPWISGSSARLK